MTLDIMILLYNVYVMQRLDATCFALSDPTRRAILLQLARGEATVTELCAPFAISQPAISRHLKVLKAARLIEHRVDGAKRPCRLNDTGISEIEAWLQTMRSTMATNYDRLDAVLVAMQATTKPAAPQPTTHRKPGHPQ